MTDQKAVTIDLEGVSVEGRHGTMLEPITLRIKNGEVFYVAAEPGHGHTALALTASGRMAPKTGQVMCNFRSEPEILRAATGIVDVPNINEPVDVLTVRVTVAEFLGLAGQPAGPKAVRAWLGDRGFSHLATTVIDQLEGSQRTALLAALAVADPHVKFLVFAMPDRRGGQPEVWHRLAQDYAAQGYAVLVGCSPSSARILSQHGLIASDPNSRLEAHSDMEILV